MNEKEFTKFQKKWNENNVEVDRFEWQTKNKIIVEKEKKLLQVLIKDKNKSILEVGCGEGANGYNLNPKSDKFIGCDYSSTRISFAKKNVPGKYYVSDGTKLIFKDNSFDIVFCKDVIHHVRKRKKLISEMYRVCKKGGRVILIESNALHIVNLGFSFAYKKEEDMRKITPNYIRRLFKPLHGTLNMDFSESYNLDRLIFHYRLGFPSLTNYSSVRLINRKINNFFKYVWPKKWRAYMIVQYTKE